MTTDLVYHSFELVADKGVDITPMVYQKFFADCPEADVVMAHMDELVRGKMMDEIYRVLMAESFSSEAPYLDWEMANHQTAYLVPLDTYPCLLDAIVYVIKGSMGQRWNADYEIAWKAKNDALLAEVSSRYANRQKRISPSAGQG